MGDDENLKAEFGLVYVRAVAYAAGFFVQESSRMMDADGIDVSLFSRDKFGLTRSPRLDIQIKTSVLGQTAETVVHDLSAKNYDELRSSNFQVPRILVVVIVPELRRDWLAWTSDSLSLKRCGFWRSLLGQPESTNATKVRVKIAADAVLSPAALSEIMQRVANKESL